MAREATTTQEMVLALIDEYKKASQTVLERAKLSYDLSNPLRAVGSGSVPRCIKFEDGSELYFHGIGCSYEGKDVCISFDFGPDGRTDGFSIGALVRFASDNNFKNLTEQQIESEVSRMKHAGDVVNPGWHPGTSLLYLRKDSEM